MHQGKDALGDAAQEDHRYPFVGQVNARVRLGVVPAAGGETVWMNLGENPDLYLARVAWWPDGRLVVQIENRAQTVLRVVAFDPATGAPTLLWEETQAVWINLHDMLKPLRDGRFIWASERSGFMHLYLHDAGGRPLHAITEGDWMVESVAGVDEERALVYLTGTRDGPLEAHLYAVPLAGGAPKRLTPAPGTHQVVLDHGKRRFIDTRSDLDQPPVTHLCSLEDGRPRVALYDRPDDRVAALDLTPPEIVTVRSRDGETLYGALYRPVGDAPGPYPVVVSVYGGPHAQRVSRAWSMTVDLRAQYLRRRGVLVFKLDNRGSARRGLAFEGAIKHNLGDVEVRDQVAGLRWLVDQGLADPDRVGVMGWSYGGYVALMCLARAPSHFKAAVAGAPVTHWDGYDTHYTERYMGLPAENSEGYEVSSVMAHVDDIRGRLLLVHGLIDENVHFRHTARLINALIRARKDYDLLLFPDERHMPRGLADRVYMESRILDWLLAVL
jgi:dipeptidyl-peptidase-4